MARDSNTEIGRRLFSSGALARFEAAVASDDPMTVVMILQDVGVEPETIGRMLLQLDKDYLLALIDAGHAAAS